MSNLTKIPTSKLARKQKLLSEMEELLKQRKLLKARTNFKDFCEYVIKDEQSGGNIKIAELQQSWIDHIGFCRNNGLHALILAPMASGKCVHEDTLFTTRKGLVKAHLLQKGDEVLGFDEATRKPAWTKVVAQEAQPRKDMWRLKLDSGRVLICSYDHKIFCENKRLAAWLPVEDLMPGDYVFIPTNWAGMSGIAGDFYGYGLTKYTENPNHVLEDKFFRYANERDIFVDRARYEKTRTLAIDNPDISPHTLNRDAAISFLSGVFDAIGIYNTSSRVYELEHPNRQALQDIQYILQSIGIPARLLRRVRIGGKTGFSLLVNRDYVGNLHDMLDCHLTNSRQLLNVRRTVLKDYVSERVIDLKPLGMGENVGVETELSTHITDGIITHNTQIVSVALPLYLIGRDNNIRIKMVCLSDDSAKERLGSIRSYLMEDQDFKDVFPGIKKDTLSEWSKHNLTIERSNKGAKDQTLSAKGVTASGIGGRADMLLVDDIFDFRTAIAQPATREQICTTYNIVWLTRLDPRKGMAVVICTRWHEQDLAGVILSDEKMRDQYGILIQAIASDFTGIEIKSIVPDRLVEKYRAALPGFDVLSSQNTAPV